MGNEFTTCGDETLAVHGQAQQVVLQIIMIVGCHFENKIHLNTTEKGQIGMVWFASWSLGVRYLESMDVHMCAKCLWWVITIYASK